MARAFEAARRALARHGGTVEKFIGDAVMAVFGLPVRHEDDALRAVRSALDMKAALATLAETLERDHAVRLDVAIGVNTGEVIAGDASLGQRLVTGDAVNVAARLEQAGGLGRGPARRADLRRSSATSPRSRRSSRSRSRASRSPSPPTGSWPSGRPTRRAGATKARWSAARRR